MENTAAVRMTRGRHLHTFCLLMTAFLSLGAGCSGASSPSAVTPRHDDRPDQEAWGIAIYLMDGDRQRAVVTAGYRMHFNNEKRTIIDQGLQVVFYGKEGLVASTLTADRGWINEPSQEITVFGNVVIVSEKYGTLETDSLRWIEKENRFVTDAAVRISTKKDMITGTGFKADTDLNHWEIIRNVRGRFDRGEELSRRFDGTDSQE